MPNPLEISKGRSKKYAGRGGLHLLRQAVLTQPLDPENCRAVSEFGLHRLRFHR
jgi:hypothetical protein